MLFESSSDADKNPMNEVPSSQLDGSKITGGLINLRDTSLKLVPSFVGPFIVSVALARLDLVRTCGI